MLSSSRLRDDAQMSNVGYRSQSFSTESIRGEMRKVRERRQFGGRKAFRQYGEIRILLARRVTDYESRKAAKRWRRP